MRQEHNYSLLHHNTFGLPCVADTFVEYSDEEELRTALAQCEGGRTLHIGQGSNLLFLTPRFRGTVLHSLMRGVDVLDRRGEGDEVLVRVEGGMAWDDLVSLCLARGWYGLENLSLIPGEVGAAAVQNIGAYGAEVGEFVEEVECLNMESLERRVFTRGECDYGYRMSLFKSPGEWGRWAVLTVTLRLSRTFTPRLDYGGLRTLLMGEGARGAGDITPEALRAAVVELRRSKLPDPSVTGNAGSFFKNPVVTTEQMTQLARRWGDIPHYPAGEGRVKLPAAWLIEQCGWKGRSLGRAGVHERQPLVLVNLGGAEGGDILALCEAVRSSVLLRFGINLEPEVNFIQ